MKRWPLLLAMVGCDLTFPDQKNWYIYEEPEGDSGTTDTATDERAPAEVETVQSVCGIQHDLEDADYWEGDTVVFRVWCAEQPPAGQSVTISYAASWIDDATLTNEGVFSWFTDGRDAGHHTITLTAGVEGQGLPETRTVTVSVVDDSTAENAEPPDPAVYHEEFGLPVVHVEPYGEIHNERVPATIRIRDEVVEGEIKYRGATSLDYPKRSYTLDFGEPEMEVDEWGDRSRGHMVLLTTFDDNSYVRQKLTFDTWVALADATDARRLAPKTFFAVLYIEGVYQGLYLAGDRVDDELARHSGFDGEGDLFKAVTHDANYSRIASNGEPKADLAMGWEKKEGEDESDLSGIRDLTERVDALTPEAVESGDVASLDVASYTDWYLLVMAGAVVDSAGKNHYTYQGDDTGLWVAVPWDFNASWGQNWKTFRKPADLLRDHTEDNEVFALLEAAPTPCADLRARYASLRADGGPLSLAWQLGRLDEYVALIEPSARRDEEKWGADYRSFFRWADDRNESGDWTDFDAEQDYLRSWLTERAVQVEQWVDGRCAGLDAGGSP